MAKKLINDTNGIEPGKDGYIETFEPDTKVDKNDKGPVPRSRLNKEIKKRQVAEDELTKLKGDQRKINEANAEDDQAHKKLYEDEKVEHEKTKIPAGKWVNHSKARREEIYTELELTDEEREEWDESTLKQVERMYKNLTSKNPRIGVHNDDPISKSGKYKTKEELATAFNDGEISEEEYNKLKLKLKRK